MGFESHLGLRFSLCPLMVDSLHLPLFSFKFCYDHDNECVLYAECDSTLKAQERFSEIILE